MSKEMDFWQYIRSKYGVLVSYSDTGWRVRQKEHLFEEGEVGVGLLKSDMGLLQDVKKLNTHKLRALSTIHNLLMNQFKIDRALQEKYGAVKVIARRRAQHG